MPSDRTSDLKRRVASTSLQRMTVVQAMALAASVLLLAGVIRLAWPAKPVAPAPVVDTPAATPRTVDDESGASPASPPAREGAILIPSAGGAPRRLPVMALALQRRNA